MHPVLKPLTEDLCVDPGEKPADKIESQQKTAIESKVAPYAKTEASADF